MGRSLGLAVPITAVAGVLVLWGGDAATDNSPLRLGLSEKVVRGVSLNDARAALRVWADEISRAAGINLAPQQNIVLSSGQMLTAVRSGAIDLFCLTIQEYRQVTPYVDTSQILTDDYGGAQMVLAVRESEGITGLAGLRGRSLIIHDAPDAGLAEPWLSVSLWNEGLGSPEQVFEHITHSTKLAQVVLPVFFGQADACLVERRGLNMMFELNPQLQQKLRLLRTSPKVASAFFACRKGMLARKRILERLVEVRATPAAKQVLTLFQSPSFALHDVDYLQSANVILDAYERHHENAGNAKK